MHQLDALKQFTTVVADTGDFRQLAQFIRDLFRRHMIGIFQLHADYHLGQY